MDDGSCIYEIPGCTDPTAINYNPDATVDDGSCEYAPCEDSCPTVYDPVCVQDASSPDGILTFPNACLAECAGYTGWFTCPIYGCTDTAAINYNPDATVNDGSCIYEIPGCTDPSALNYNPEATVDDGSCEYGICEDSCDPNWYEPVCVYDGSTTTPIDFQNPCYAECAGYTNWQPCHTDIPGCMDPNAINYNPDATFDDGSCIYDNNACDNCDPSLNEPVCVFDAAGGVLTFQNPCYAECEGFTNWQPCNGTGGANPFANTESGSVSITGFEATAYPNPASEQITVESNLFTYNVEVFDVTGKLVHSTRNITNGITELNVQEYTSGLYFIKVYDSEFVKTIKVSVTK